MRDAIGEICGANTHEEGADFMAAFIAGVEEDAPPEAKGFTAEDFGIRVENLRQDVLPEAQPPTPRNAASIPKAQPHDAEDEVGLDLNLTAAEVGWEVRQAPSSADSGDAAAGRALQAELKPKFAARIETAQHAIETRAQTKPSRESSQSEAS